MDLKCLAAAQLFELCSMGLRLPDRQLVEVLASGEYGSAMDESLRAAGVECPAGMPNDSLQPYEGQDVEELFHKLRAEYTRLFVGVPHAEVSPYAGVYYAESVGVTPVLYVNKESMEVERFMRKCGMGRPEGTNEPLDHIAAELEFLEYLVLDATGALSVENRKAVPEGALEEFFSVRFSPFARQFASNLAGKTDEPLFGMLASILAAIAA